MRTEVNSLNGTEHHAWVRRCLAFSDHAWNVTTETTLEIGFLQQNFFSLVYENIELIENE